MSLQSHLVPWSGRAYRHIPAGSQYDVLDFRFAGRSSNNRWNSQGDPTLYLAGDEGVLIAEWGRHFEVDRSLELRTRLVERSLFQLALKIDLVLDLRQEDVWSELSLEGAPTCFLDLSVAQATANYIRATTEAQAILVPSAGFLDQLDRWCLVLFLEKLPQSHQFITDVIPQGTLRIN
jgi:RES domain-containing protein